MFSNDAVIMYNYYTVIDWKPIKVGQIRYTFFGSINFLLKMALI